MPKKNYLKWKNYANKKVIFVITFLISIILIFILLFYLYVPNINLKGEKKVVLGCGDKYKEEGYNASIFGINVNKRIKVSNNINYNKIGDYKIRYQIKNIFGISKNNIRTIKIIDKSAPVIELVENDVMLEIGKDYKEPGYTATDNYDKNITDKVIIENNVDNKKTGEYEVIYKVNDSSNNETVVKRKVIVTDPNVLSIPILTYHHFMSNEEKYMYAPNDKYTMSTSVFEEQLKYLHDNSFNSITLDDFYLWYYGKKILSKKDFLLVIDDGNISSYIYAMPLIEKYGFKATIFVITGRIKNEERIWDPSRLQFFNEKIIDDIRKNHNSIALASHTHYLHSQINGGCAIASKTEDEIYEDIKISKEVIKSDYLAYPFGCYNSISSKAMKRAEFKMGFGFNDDRRATRNDDVYGIKRININASVSMNKFRKWLEV